MDQKTQKISPPTDNSESGLLKRVSQARMRMYHSPAKILLIMTICVFVFEFIDMMILIKLPHESPIVHGLVDSTILIFLLSPFLYFFLFRPLLSLVDELRATETDLRRERDKAENYLNIAGVLIIVLDRDGKVILINRKGCEILGYDESEITGKDWFENFIPPRIKYEIKTHFYRLIRGEEESLGYYENPVLTKFGEERVILWNNSVIRENGVIAGTMSSGEDITERKEAEKALIESETRYRLIHNTAFDGIIVSSAEGTVIDTNPSADHIFGYARGELIGKPLVTIMPEIYREKHLQGIRRFLETGKSNVQGKVLELQGMRKNGEIFPVELVINSFTFGGALNFTGTIRDITERKRAEREKEFIQARLSQAQKMEAIGRLAGGIAHDFNNILTAIRGNAELAIEDVPKSSPGYARLDEIILSVLHASKLTRQLLLFSRGQPFQRVPLNVNRVVEGLMIMVTRLIGEDITISTELDPDLWAVLADEGNMEQVVMNLAVNARDAMPKGGQLLIRTENIVLTPEACKDMPEARPGQFVAITVADTGVGMEKEVLQRIFEPFFTTKETGKGTGLGLSVVYGIVKQHEGWITVQSSLGKGTSFKIYLPGITVPAVSAEPEREISYGNGEKVLIVEDEPKVRDFAKRALMDNGYIVLDASTVKNAVEIFEKEGGSIDLLFTDLLLPDGNGLELAGKLLEKKSALSVLITGSFMDFKSQWQTINQKGYLFLHKPYSLSNLLSVVGDAIGHA